MGTALPWITDSVAGQSPQVPPDRPALALDDQQPLTWQELHDLEVRYARALQRAGVGRGDRVAILMHNCVEYIVWYLAIARAGAISVRLNFRLTAPELEFILSDSGAATLIFDSDLAATVTQLRASTPVATFIARQRHSEIPPWAASETEFLAAASGADLAPFPEMDQNDPVSLIYTSGTTGRPKGAIWTHGTTLWFATIQALKWQFDERTVTLTPGPLFHAGGLEALLLPALVSHGTAVTFTSGGFTIERLLEVARAQQVTMMLLYSFMSYECLRLPDVAELVPASMRRITCGGDTLMPWVYDEFARVLPQIEILQQYGLTEGGAVSTCLDHRDGRERAGSVGRALPLTEIKVGDEFGQALPSGEVGEVYVRSPAVSPGYWQRPDATAETFQDGWCRTGDLGWIDADGFLTLAGRAKDMIRSGGENIYPAEIESVLTAAPGVADAAVIGVPDDRYGEVGCAFVVPVAGHSIHVDELRDFCTNRLARYKVPRYFEVLDELPRNPSGKVLKFVLRQQHGAGTEPSVG